jgi:hypothetical protein
MSGFEPNVTQSILGGGIPGGRPGAGFANSSFCSADAMQRKILRKAFRSNMVKVPGGTIRSTAGPFRTAFNQGEVLSRVNQSCGGSNQVNDVNSRILRLSMGRSVSQRDCQTVTQGVTPLEVPLYSGNQKYVCDSSLFTKFKGLSMINKNYNDKSFGGDDSHGSASVLMNIRRN